jgi:predicted O-linked N-acetylglucosamine transferase (SPINDLY family)
VPVLTLNGPDFYSRIGVHCLLPAGLPELVAQSWDDYVARAVALTADAGALDRLRARVRPGFEASAHRDEAGFTQRFEAALRRIFDERLCDAERTAA